MRQRSPLPHNTRCFLHTLRLRVMHGVFLIFASKCEKHWKYGKLAKSHPWALELSLADSLSLYLYTVIFRHETSHYHLHIAITIFLLKNRVLFTTPINVCYTVLSRALLCCWQYSHYRQDHHSQNRLGLNEVLAIFFDLPINGGLNVSENPTQVIYFFQFRVFTKV